MEARVSHWDRIFCFFGKRVHSVAHFARAIAWVQTPAMNWKNITIVERTLDQVEVILTELDAPHIINIHLATCTDRYCLAFGVTTFLIYVHYRTLRLRLVVDEICVESHFHWWKRLGGLLERIRFFADPVIHQVSQIIVSADLGLAHIVVNEAAFTHD